nr:DUF3626 domain-containing protein [Nesterenkonia salmonea]
MIPPLGPSMALGTGTTTSTAARLASTPRIFGSAAHDYLDDYVEAHVHSGLNFTDDVEAVVLDPCHRTGFVAEAAERLGCAVDFHPGFRLCTSSLDARFRGTEPVALAQRLGEVITPVP